MVMNPILENYVAVANMIADTFGDHCEVILHDFSIPQNSVVYTRNNVVHKSPGRTEFYGILCKRSAAFKKIPG